MEPSRPPSKGGNAKALHQHIITIDGQKYGFRASGYRQWIYKSDTISFQYVINHRGYRDILKPTLDVRDKNGERVNRGNPDVRKKRRLAPTRTPGSRRELNS